MHGEEKLKLSNQETNVHRIIADSLLYLIYLEKIIVKDYHGNQKGQLQFKDSILDYKVLKNVLSVKYNNNDFEVFDLENLISLNYFSSENEKIKMNGINLDNKYIILKSRKELISTLG